MNTIISTKKNKAGFHDVETRSNTYVPEGYLTVPQEFIAKLNDGYCEITLEAGVFTGVTPTEKPEPSPSNEVQIAELEAWFKWYDRQVVKHLTGRKVLSEDEYAAMNATADEKAAEINELREGV